jgi:transposase
MPHIKGKELSVQARSRICELHTAAGYGAKKIHSLHPEWSINTIKTTIRRESLRNDNVTRKRSGMPRRLSDEQRDYLYDIITHTNPHATNHDLCAEVDYTVKERTIQRLVRELGRKKWLQRRRPDITPEHAKQRLEWAARYKHIDWTRVVWSDECTVERGAGVRPVWTFLRPSEQLQQGDVKCVRTGQSKKKMFWAAFRGEERTGLVALDGDPESARGGVTGRVIVEVYKAFLPTIVRPGDIFMHDGASVHTAHIVRAILREMGVIVMIWPPYSPDLNPIENLWAIMKAEIYKLYPELEFARDSDDTLARLIEAAKEAWHEIEERVLYNLSISMHKRIEAVEKAEGWYTKY